MDCWIRVLNLFQNLICGPSWQFDCGRHCSGKPGYRIAVQLWTPDSAWRHCFVISSSMRSSVASAMSASSAGDRFCIGWGTQARPAENPNDFICASAAGTNASDATAQPGMPRRSRVCKSCKLHDVHDPQSASPSTTTSQRSMISCSTDSGAGLVCVGFSKRKTLRPRPVSRSST